MKRFNLVVSDSAGEIFLRYKLRKGCKNNDDAFEMLLQEIGGVVMLEGKSV